MINFQINLLGIYESCSRSISFLALKISTCINLVFIFIFAPHLVQTIYRTV